MADIKQAIEYAKANPDSPFAAELRKRIEGGQMNKELADAGLSAPTPSNDISTVSRVGSVIEKAGNKVNDAISGTGDYAGQSSIRRGVEATAAASSAVPQVVGTLAPQAVREAGTAAGQYVGGLFSKLTDLLGGTKVAEDFVVQHPKAAKALEETLGTASGLGSISGDILTAGGGTKTLNTVVDKTPGIVAPVIDATKNVASAVASTPAVVSNVVKGVGDTSKMIADYAAQIPSRIATNVAESQRLTSQIKELPTKLAQKAAVDGVDVQDVKALYNIPAVQKNPIRQLATTVKNFAEGTSKVHPEEVVGKPIVQRIKELNTVRSTVGKQLGGVADTLGEVTTRELATPVFTSLRKVPGLSGLKISKSGVLDFIDTSLQTLATKADRSAIQNIFSDAIKAGTGKQKHLLRQELFEVLGGKKKSLANITGTQEKAYQAVRQGLADVLESKNSSYKALSGKYRTLSQPIEDMQKFLKSSSGLDEDLLNMKAGLLARRLTSNAASNPEIRSILRAMDKATKVPGKATLSVEHLQDAYNILNKYYDIAAKTGLQGQVRAGLENATGFTDAALKFAKRIGGKTDVVRIKAFEEALQEALK